MTETDPPKLPPRARPVTEQDVGTVPHGPRGPVAALLVPAVICLALIGISLAFEPWAGVVLGIAGLAYLITATVLGLLGHRFQDQLPFRDQLVARLELTWLAAWLVGILTFALAGAALSPFVLDASSTEKPFTLSPVFWLLAVPFVFVYLVSTPLVCWAGRRLEHRAKKPGQQNSTPGPTRD